MSFFKTAEESPKYHAISNGADWALQNCSDEQLERWGTDTNCIERDKCAAYLTNRRTKRAQLEEERTITRATKREELQANPFDPRIEISADAQHIASKIVKHLWIIFVLLPIVLSILWAILK